MTTASLQAAKAIGPSSAVLPTHHEHRYFFGVIWKPCMRAKKSLVVVLIAIPFGAPSGRRNVFVGVAASIFICFAYFVLQRFGMALGTGGYLPPLIGAWLPNVLFGGAGLWLVSIQPPTSTPASTR